MDVSLLQDLEYQPLPTKTYHVEGHRIIGTVDGLEAIRQAVDKILRTERFINLIYSADYGIELMDLIGADFEFVKADLERVITEALTADDRVRDVSDFEMKQISSDSLLCRFTIDTAEGSYSTEAEVVV